MRYFLTRGVPPFSRVLLIESGSRQLFEQLIPGIYDTHGRDIVIDLVTCYGGLPQGLDAESSTVFRVTDYPGPPGRRRLLSELRGRKYTIVGMICSGEPIMAKWKWYLALGLAAKTFVLNENGDYFWFDRFHLGVITHFALYRAGLTGAGAVPTLARLLFFPLTVLYLLLFAGWVHLKRAVRMAFR